MDMMNLNLLKLRIVELLAKHHKITAVAEQLELKQPTVTFHMKNMERDFGVKLFDSRMGKIVLTDAGLALHHYAVKIGVLAAEAQRAVTEFDHLRKGSLMIGASYVPATYLLPAVFHRFSREHPGIRLSLTVKTAPVIRHMLEKHEIDLGLLSAEPFESPALRADMLGTDDLVLIFAPDHPLAAEAQPSTENIASSSFVLHGTDSSTRRLTEKWLEQNRRRLPSFLEFDSLEAIKQTVMLGEHVAFVSRMAVENEVQRGLLEMRAIPGHDLRRYVYLVTNANRYRSALINAFSEHLTAGLKQPGK